GRLYRHPTPGLRRGGWLQSQHNHRRHGLVLQAECNRLESAAGAAPGTNPGPRYAARLAETKNALDLGRLSVPGHTLPGVAAPPPAFAVHGGAAYPAEPVGTGTGRRPDALGPYFRIFHLPEN